MSGRVVKTRMNHFCQAGNRISIFRCGDLLRRCNFEIHFRAFAAANPVPLHFLERIAPVNRVEIGQQFLGVGGDAEHPLAHRLADDRKAADFALAVNDFLVGQHRAEFGTPVHRRFADVGKTFGIAINRGVRDSSVFQA